MKRLMRRKPAISGIGASSVMHIRNDLEELGSVDIVTYISRFSPLFPDFGGVLESKPSDLRESNHIEIALNDAVVVQLFRGPWGFSGNFLDQNLSQGLGKEIERILAKNGYYTGEMAWKYIPWLPFIPLLATALFTLLAGINAYELLYSQNVSNLKLFSFCINCAAAAMAVFLYRRYFSTQRDATKG